MITSTHTKMWLHALHSPCGSVVDSLRQNVMFMNVQSLCFTFVGFMNLGYWPTFRFVTWSAGFIIKEKKTFSLGNYCGKQHILDWQSLLEGSYFSNQKVIIKRASWAPPCNLVTVARSPPDRRVIAELSLIHCRWAVWLLARCLHEWNI